MVWMLQRVLTHPASRAVGIDPWLTTEKLGSTEMELAMARARANCLEWTSRSADDSDWFRCQLFRANSAEVLRRMAFRGGFAGITRGTVDLCLVDGNHNALAVLDDCRLVWLLLRPGGLMVLDDVRNFLPKRDHVREGLDRWLDEEGDPEPAWSSRFMEAYRKP